MYAPNVSFNMEMDVKGAEVKLANCIKLAKRSIGCLFSSMQHEKVGSKGFAGDVFLSATLLG